MINPYVSSFKTEGGFNAADYELYDALTQIAYPLTESIDIDSKTASVGRYSIRKAGKRAAIESAIFLTQEAGTVTAHTNKGMVVEMKAYGIDGQLENISLSSTLNVNLGIKVITVTLDDGTTQTYKIMVK